MISYERPIYSAPVGQITFRNVFRALSPEPMHWLITELWMTAIPGSSVDVLDLERKVSKADGQGAWFSHLEMVRIAENCDQMIDGEFLGYLTASGSESPVPVVRIDFFDSATATVIIDETALSVSNELEELLGVGVPQSVMETRASEI